MIVATQFCFNELEAIVEKAGANTYAQDKNNSSKNNLLWQKTEFLSTFVSETVIRNTFYICIAIVTDNFISVAYLFVCALFFATAVASFIAIAVFSALVVTLLIMRTFIIITALRIAFEFIVTEIVDEFESLKAYIGVDAGISATAKCCVDAVLVLQTAVADGSCRVKGYAWSLLLLSSLRMNQAY